MAGTRAFVPGDRVSVVNFNLGPSQSTAGLPVLIVIRRLPYEAAGTASLQLSDGSIQPESSLVLVTPAGGGVVVSYTTLSDGVTRWPTYVSG